MRRTAVLLLVVLAGGGPSSALPQVAGASAPQPGPQGRRAYDVGFSGAAQWLADLNGDGRADLVYNRDNGRDTAEYRVLLADQGTPFGTGRFGDDMPAGRRKGDVGDGGRAQWLADLNGDGRADLVYEVADKKVYRVMFGTREGTLEQSKLAGTRRGEIDYGSRAEWLADVNGDGRADFVFNLKGTQSYLVMLARADGTFAPEKWAGARDGEVGYGGHAQWMADVDGDGRADLVYNVAGTKDYRVMLGQADGTFGAVKPGGTREGEVGLGGDGQWLVDVTGDGAADFVYDRAGSQATWVLPATPGAPAAFGPAASWGDRTPGHGITFAANGQGFPSLTLNGRRDLLYNWDGREYWLMESLGTRFGADRFWASSPYEVARGGQSAFLADVNGDGLSDLVFNRKDSREEYVIHAPRPERYAHVKLLDVWGEGFIRTGSGTVSGFQTSANLNKRTQKVSTGPNQGQLIPSLVPVDQYAAPVFPIEDGAVEIMTLMNAPITVAVAGEMYRTLEKSHGVVLLFGFNEKDKEFRKQLANFESVFVTQHGFVSVTAKATVGYPFNTITMLPVRVYASSDRAVHPFYGKGSQVGGAGLSRGPSDEFAGGGIVHDEL